MTARVCTIGELVRSSKLKERQYVSYVPDKAVYTTNSSKTGCEQEKIVTDLDAGWIVHYIDEKNGYVYLRTDRPVNKLCLEGKIGYDHGAEEIHIACNKCYSNKKLGIEARSMVVEDVNKVSKEVPQIREGFYHYETNVFSNENEDTGYSWIASPCLHFLPSRVGFCMVLVSRTSVGGYCLYNSEGKTYGYRCGFHPLVSLSSQLLIDISDETKDGSSVENAWKLVVPHGVQASSNNEVASEDMELPDEEQIINISINADNLENVVDLVPYERLSGEVRELVDKDVKRLSKMKDKDIMQYGWDIQTSKNQLLNDAILQFKSMNVDDIEKVIDEIMNSGKSLMPRKHFLGKVSLPTYEERRNFAGKVGDLEQAIKAQIKRIFKANKFYFKLIFECKRIIDNYGVCIMAIERYLANTRDAFLEEVLVKKIASLKASRVANMQSAIMYMTLYRDNALLVNRLYEIINVNLYQLQEQILIQTGISDLKKILNDCRSIKNSISNLTSSNISELTATTKLINATTDESAQDEEAERLMKEMVNGLRAIAKRDN